ncbi:septal ring lytic transglycosylase RlpA family protein [Brevundimonas sp. VNH65]|uniref:septal ring lytic transglycosylase RlpA family protein n=1 Tax=Brevundimonas sp. VNH65 TaxID=3400917 RepID=UPI003BFF9538
MVAGLRIVRIMAVAVAAMSLAACGTLGFGGGRGGEVSGGRAVVPVVSDPAPIVSGTMRPYQVRGRWYHPAEQPGYEETGLASWYGDAFNGRPTSTGERFDMHAMTAAHKTLPLPGLVEVTNLANGRTVVLRVNDRGPFVEGRIIDLSRGAASELGMLQQGVGRVRVRYLGRAPRGGGVGEVRYAGRTPVPVSSSASVREGPFWVQAGAYSDRTVAQVAAESLGDRARVERAAVGGRDLFRIMIGPWDDANSAEQARQGAVARGVRDALLISGR